MVSFVNIHEIPAAGELLSQEEKSYRKDTSAVYSVTTLMKLLCARYLFFWDEHLFTLAIFCIIIIFQNVVIIRTSNKPT